MLSKRLLAAIAAFAAVTLFSGCDRSAVPLGPSGSHSPSAVVSDPLAEVGAMCNIDWVAQWQSTYATRTEAQPGSSWYVAYGVLENDCTTPVTLTRVSVDELPQGPSTASYLHQSVVVPLAASDTPFALWPAAQPRPGQRALGGYVLRPGTQVNVAAKIQIADTATPQVGPSLTLQYEERGVSVRLPMKTKNGICTCTSVPSP